MCIIVHSWVQAAHLLRSLTFQIKDDVNDPVWLFVLQFVLQLLWILRGAFGLKQCCLWSRLNCLTGWKMKIYLHICEALWQSHCAAELLTCTPFEEKFKGFVQAQVISIFHIVYFYKVFFLSINPHSFQCYTHLQYKIVIQLSVLIWTVLLIQAPVPHYRQNCHSTFISCQDPARALPHLTSHTVNPMNGQ